MQSVVSRAAGGARVPTAVRVEAQGRVRSRHIGCLGSDAVLPILRRLCVPAAPVPFAVSTVPAPHGKRLRAKVGKRRRNFPVRLSGKLGL